MIIERTAKQHGINCVVRNGKSSTRIYLSDGIGWAGAKILHSDTFGTKKIKMAFINRSLRNMCDITNIE